MKTATITIEREIQIKFNDQDPLFLQAFDDFRSVISKDADVKEMLEHVAYNVSRSGTDRMVEGVGYVGVNGFLPDKSPYSGIMITYDAETETSLIKIEEDGTRN